MKQAVVGYNRNRLSFGEEYRVGTHKIETVAVLEVPDDATPEYVWRAMNRVDGSAIEQVPDGERSMSVGDVVHMDGKFYAAAICGFDEVAL